MNIDKDKAYLLAYGFVAERLGKLQAAATEGGIGIKLIRDENLDFLVRELLLKQRRNRQTAKQHGHLLTTKRLQHLRTTKQPSFPRNWIWSSSSSLIWGRTKYTPSWK